MEFLGSAEKLTPSSGRPIASKLCTISGSTVSPLRERQSSFGLQQSEIKSTSSDIDPSPCNHLLLKISHMVKRLRISAQRSLLMNLLQAGVTLASAGNSPFTMLICTSAKLRPTKGILPLSVKYKVTPVSQMSTGRPRYVVILREEFRC